MTKSANNPTFEAMHEIDVIASIGENLCRAHNDHQSDLAALAKQAEFLFTEITEYLPDLDKALLLVGMGSDLTSDKHEHDDRIGEQASWLFGLLAEKIMAEKRADAKAA